ncbi:MAG: GMP synthase [Candidatus Sericytochromatia bacterium]|nr:GMP synthase [Candidatus Tanganyikabacteria bacterium]
MTPESTAGAILAPPQKATGRSRGTSRGTKGPAATGQATAQSVVRVALLDLYKGVANQGMRCLRQQLADAAQRHPAIDLQVTEFDIRGAQQAPDASFDIYVSSGGPGSPFDGEGEAWESAYFRLLDAVWAHNQGTGPRKHFLAICHSFQMMCRHFGLAEVEPRRSGSFGILPVHLTDAGRTDPVMGCLPDPFYGADFREWQVLKPRHETIQAVGASILAIEKERPHVPLERAVMAMRVSPEILGCQFHPEADPEGMQAHFSKTEQRDNIVAKHGQAKYDEIQFRMTEQGSMPRTYGTFIPEFMRQAVAAVLASREP